MINDKRIFIKEALGNKKKYLSYRMDLMLYKIIISILVFIATYFLFLDLVLSVLCSLLTLLILTLLNKINIDKKHKKGKELLLTKIKINYFSSKIEEMNLGDFELLVRFFFEKEGYKNIIKKAAACIWQKKKDI